MASAVNVFLAFLCFPLFFLLRKKVCVCGGRGGAGGGGCMAPPNPPVSQSCIADSRTGFLLRTPLKTRVEPQKKPLEIFCKKVFLEILQISHENTCVENTLARNTKPLARNLFSAQSNICDGTFFAKIINSLKALSIFAKKAPM